MPRMRLDKPHEDAGREYQPGDVITVDDGTAAWLLTHGIARLVTEMPTAAPAAAIRKRKSED